MKKKGFTLIELLAVIVILAIIALIATPLVLKYIEKSREESFRVSTEGIKDAVNYYIVGKTTKGESLAQPEVVNIQDLDLKNKENLSGTVTIYKVGKEYTVSYNNITDGKHVLTGTSGDTSVDNIKNSKKPILISMDEKVVIDNYNKYVYGIDDVSAIESKFEVINGELEYVKTINGTYSTGAQIIVKKDKNIYETYTVICFAELTGDGVVNVIDASIVNVLKLSPDEWDYQYFAADINRNGIIDSDDYQLVKDVMTERITIDQTTGKAIKN